jgi:DNA-binding NarL/FixJ family response regulator
MLNVFVIEDHPVIVAGLKSIFHLSADGIKITGNAESVDNLIGRKDHVVVDLILLDLYLPGSLAGDNVRKLKSAFPGKPIVVYTSEDSDTWKKKMAGYGVNAYITKNATKEDILVTLKKAGKGEYIINLKSKIPITVHPGLDTSLFTHNQLEILKLLFEEKTQEMIAKYEESLSQPLKRH